MNPLDEDNTSAPKVVEKTEKVTPREVVVPTTDGKDHKIKVVVQKLKNTRGEDVPVKDYFYAPEGVEAIAPPFFNKSFGLPVDREDLTEIFDKVFKPVDNFVFLKSMNKEVYGVLIPLKYTDIGPGEDSILADFQYHAISFVLDGSVNYQKLTSKLKEIAKRVAYDER